MRPALFFDLELSHAKWPLRPSVRRLQKTWTAILWFVLAGLPLSRAIAQQQTFSRGLELCSTLADQKTRVLCYQQNLQNGPGSATAPRIPDSTAAETSASPGWRLVRVHGPAGDPDAVWIMRSVELSQSDSAIAGVAFRCGNPAAEMLVILLAPLSPRSHTRVVLDFGNAHSEFPAKLVAPATALLLPPDASVQTIASSNAAPDAKLNISVETDQSGTVHGEVSLSGLMQALRHLQTSCETQ